MNLEMFKSVYYIPVITFVVALFWFILYIVVPSAPRWFVLLFFISQMSWSFFVLLEVFLKMDEYKNNLQFIRVLNGFIIKKKIKERIIPFIVAIGIVVFLCLLLLIPQEPIESFWAKVNSNIILSIIVYGFLVALVAVYFYRLWWDLELKEIRLIIKSVLLVFSIGYFFYSILLFVIDSVPLDIFSLLSVIIILYVLKSVYYPSKKRTLFKKQNTLPDKDFYKYKKGIVMSSTDSFDLITTSQEGKNFYGELVKFQSSIPGLPKLPTHPIEYQGWFKEVKKGVAIRKEQQSIYEYAETLRRYNELHEEYLELMKKYVEAQETKNNMILAKEKEKLIPMQMDVEKTELLARKKRSEVDIAKSEAKIKELQNPQQPSQTSIREQKEEELYLAQIQAQIDRIKNPPAKPSIADPLIRRAEKITELKKNMDIEEEKARKNGLNEKMIGDIKRMFTLEIGNIMEGK